MNISIFQYGFFFLLFFFFFKTIPFFLFSVFWHLFFPDRDLTENDERTTWCAQVAHSRPPGVRPWLGVWWGYKSLMWKDIVWLSCKPTRFSMIGGGGSWRKVHLNQRLIRKLSGSFFSHACVDHDRNDTARICVNRSFDLHSLPPSPSNPDQSPISILSWMMETRITHRPRWVNRKRSFSNFSSFLFLVHAGNTRDTRCHDTARFLEF